MAVTRTSTGALVSSAAALTATFAAGATAGDLGILIVETANQTITTPSGWTQIDSFGVGTAGAAAATRYSVYAKSSITSGDISSGISVSDSGDHQNAVLLTFTGYDSTTPYVQTFFASNSSAETGPNINGSTGHTTTVNANDLVLGIICTDRDSATVSTNSGATWANIAGSNSFIVNVSSATAAGGGIIVNQLTPSGTQTADVSFTCTMTSSIWAGIVLAIKAPASGRTATLAKTLDAVTASSAAQLKINSTLTKTLGAVTLSSNASFTSRIATLTKTLGTLTLSSASKLALSATLTKTLGSLTASSAAKLAIKGTTSKILDTLVLASASKLKINGTLAKTLGTLTLSSLGSHGATSSGNLAKTLGTLTLSSAGKVAIKATLSQTLGALAGTEVGKLRIAGTLSKTLGSLSLVSSGTAPQPPIFGSCADNLGTLVLTSHAFSVISSLRRRGKLGEPINAYREHKYIRNGRGYWTK